MPHNVSEMVQVSTDIKSYISDIKHWALRHSILFGKMCLFTISDQTRNRYLSPFQFGTKPTLQQSYIRDIEHFLSNKFKTMNMSVSITVSLLFKSPSMTMSMFMPMPMPMSHKDRHGHEHGHRHRPKTPVQRFVCRLSVKAWFNIRHKTQSDVAHHGYRTRVAIEILFRKNSAE